MSYDETYKNTENNSGADPGPVLRNYYRRLDKSRPVLDIGAGQGRNALFLAREGFTVDAIDPSKVATETVATIAVDEGLGHP